MGFTVIHRKAYPGFRLWASAFVVNGIGMIILGHRSLLPDFLTIVVANTLLVCHLAMINRGLILFTKQQAGFGPEILPVLLVAITFPYFTYVDPNVNARIFIISASYIALYLRSGISISRPFLAHLRPANRLLSFIFFFSAGWFLFRAVITFFFEKQIANFMNAGLLHGGTVVIYCLASILIMTGLIIVNNQMVEIELRESEKRYRTLFDKSPLGIVQIDQAGIIVDANEAFCQLFGARKENLVGFCVVDEVFNQDMRMAINDALSGKDGIFEGLYKSVLTGKIVETRALT